MNNTRDLEIIKASGETEIFSEEKLVQSLARSGISVDVASQALNQLKKHLKKGITSEEIFGKVSNYLQRNAPKPEYYNYILKRSIMKLGPTGHPFERLVGDILEQFGYETQVGVTLSGDCVNHEVDVIAVKENQTFFTECKYHNQPGTKSDVQVALYTYARFLDIEKAMKKLFDGNRQYKPWIIVNTKLTYDAIDYAKCMGMRISSWSFPKEDNLHDMVTESGLHPITVLESIPDDKLQALLKRDIVTCHRLSKAIDSGSISEIFNISEINNIKEDIKEICQKYGWNNR